MSGTHKLDLSGYQLLVETLAGAGDITTMGGQFSQLLVGSMGIKGASVFIVNPETEELELLATQGLSMDYVKKGPILVDRSIRLTSNREPVVIEDVTRSDALQYPDMAEKEGIRSIISLPLDARGRIIGALRLYHSQPWKVTGEEMILLEVLGKNLGMALRYFRLTTVVRSMKATMEELHPIWL